MELISAAFLLLLSVITLVVLVPLIRSKSSPDSEKKSLPPPGPVGLPFVGSIHHLFMSQPQVALRDLAEKHGPVMLLRLGQVDTVVVSSPEAAREVLREKDLCFASRPSLMAAEIICYGNVDLAFAPYGAYWRELRKICMLQLLGTRKVRQFAPVRDAETMLLVRQVLAAGDSGREAVNLGRLLVSCTNAITGKATFGERCGRELQEQFLPAMETMLKNSSGFCVGDLFPSLWFVDTVTGLKPRLRRAHRQLDALFDKIIADCDSRRKQKTATATTTSEDDDLLTTMLNIRDEGKLDFPFKTTNIKAIIVDLFTAGTDTTSSIAEWVMSELMRNRDAMAMAQAEVRRALDGKSQQDHESSMDALPYTRKVIKETMRLHPVVPLLLPRLCRESCNIGGFEVREGTRVLVNAWAMARSSDHWQNAEEFRPERFEVDGGAAADYKGTRFEYLPFGSGRRMCPGDGFGMAVLELAVARLLYYFDWSLPGGMRPDELDMEMTVSSTAKRRNKLHLVASPYKVPLGI